MSRCARHLRLRFDVRRPPQIHLPPSITLLHADSLEYACAQLDAADACHPSAGGVQAWQASAAWSDRAASCVRACVACAVGERRRMNNGEKVPRYLPRKTVSYPDDGGNAYK
eukprot:4631612-Pleurochrysis_carterae.AAC.1